MTAVPPARVTTWPPRFGMRILSPLKSPIVLIFFRNHPAICGAAFEMGRGTRLNGA
jgi:hypothetical protein